MASKEAASLLTVAEGHLDKDEFAQALELATKASSLFEKDANLQGLADATRIVVSAHCGLQDRKLANEVATEALAKFKGKEGWQCEEAKMLLSVAEVNYDKRGSKNRELANQSALEALRIFKEQGMKELEAATLLTLGNISLKDRKSPQEQTGRQALNYAKQAGQLFHKLGDKKRKALAAHNVATAHLVLKDQQSALTAANEALRLFRELGDKKLEAFELQCIASWQAEFAHAAGYDASQSAVIPVAKEALEASRKIESADGHAIEASVLATLVKLQAQYSPAEARTLAKQGVKKFRDLQDKQAEAISLMALAGVSGDDTEGAVNAVKKAKAAYKSVGDSSGQSNACRILSELDLMLNRSEAARDMAEMAIKSAEKVKDPRALAQSIFAVARVHLIRGEADACIEYAREARNLCATVKWMQGEAESLVLIVRAEMIQKHYEEAKGPLQEAIELMQTANEEIAVCKLMLMGTELHFLLEEYDDAEKLGGSLAFYGDKLGNQGISVTAQLVVARIAVTKLQKSIEEDPEENSKFDNPELVTTKRMCNQALKSARLTRQPEAVCQAQVLMAQIYMLEVAFGSSIEIALGASIEAQKLAKKAGDRKCQATALMLSSNAHHFLKEMDEAWYAAETAQRIFSELGDVNGALEAAALLEKLAPFWKKEEKKPVVPMWGMPQQMADGAMAEMAIAAAPRAEDTMNFDISNREAVDLTVGISIDLVVDRMRNILEDNLGLNVDDIENDSPLMSSGVTSGGSVLLTGALGADFPKVKLPATLAFDYPSINAVCEFILHGLTDAQA